MTGEQTSGVITLLLSIILAHRAEKDDIYTHPLAAKTFASLIHVSGWRLSVVVWLSVALACT